MTNNLPFDINDLDYLEYVIANGLIKEVTYDATWDVGYVYLSGEFSQRKRTQVLTDDDGVEVAIGDYDTEDRLVGIEMLYPMKYLASK